MKQILLVFFGSGFGGVARFLLGKWINNFHTSSFPYGTFFANFIACFILGIVVGLAQHKQIISTNTLLFLVVGFCGGFSTLSSFSYESLNLYQQGNYFYFTLYIFSSILFSILATYFGILVISKI